MKSDFRTVLLSGLVIGAIMSGLVLHFEVTCIELLPAEEGCQGAEFKTVNLAAGSLVAPVLAAFWKFFQSA